MSETMTTSVLADIVSGAKKPTCFGDARTEAEVFLAENGIPSKRNEEWKYTNIKRIFDKGLSVAGPASFSDKGSLGLNQAVRLELVNGQAPEQFPVVDGLTVYSTSKKATDQLGTTGVHKIQELAALNTALFEDALVIHVSKGKQVESTLLIDHFVGLQENNLANARLLLILEDNASLKCIHHFRGKNNSDTSLLNQVTEVFVGKNAQLEINLIQDIGSGNMVSTTEVACQRDSSFTMNTLQFSGKLLRNNVNVKLKGENIGTHLHGFYMLNGNEHFDNHTLVDHLMPNCESNEIYRGLLAGKSTGVFNGKVYVHPAAQKTNAFQKNNNILLSDDATMNSKPELEIYADDVKCSHGSTTGQLDEEAVFYLRARGLDEFGATALLLNAFATEVLENVSNEELRGILEDKIQTKLKEMRR